MAISGGSIPAWSLSDPRRGRLDQPHSRPFDLLDLGAAEFGTAIVDVEQELAWVPG